MAYELSVLSGERPPLPATASRDEAFAAHYAPAAGVARVSAIVDSPDPAYARELRHALNGPKPPDLPATIIFDADRTADAATCRGESQRVAVAGFPRPEHVLDLHASGVRTMVSKLAPLSELRAAIERAVTIQR
jgi:hypothetical protein